MNPIFPLCLVAMQSIGAAGQAADLPRPAVVDANNRFAVDLYTTLNAQPGNLFCSPFSISVALAMTYAGARGETAQEMARVLHLPENPRGYADLVASLTRPENEAYRLDVANSLWPAARLVLALDFMRVIDREFHAQLTSLDYGADPEAARQRINAWVEQATQDKIRDLMPTGSIDRSTQLVLANAVYFKGKWVAPFKKERTHDAPFHMTPSRNVSAPLMQQMGSFGFYKGDGLQVLEMPYVGDRLTMVVLLPDEVGGLPALEKALTAERFDQWLGQVRPQQVAVSLPRFKAESSFLLNDTLATMGMPTPFTARADFSGITGDRGLFISAVVHKAYADVNEEGTEAAAATGIAMTKTAMPTGAIFRADHPFLFAIRDRETGLILFLGRLADPKAG